MSVRQPYPISSAGGGTTTTSVTIPQLNSDPGSLTAESAWVLKTVSGGAGGGKLQAFLGLGFPYAAVGAGGSISYQFSYRTLEGNTKRVTIN